MSEQINEQINNEITPVAAQPATVNTVESEASTAVVRKPNWPLFIISLILSGIMIIAGIVVSLLPLFNGVHDDGNRNNDDDLSNVYTYVLSIDKEKTTYTNYGEEKYFEFTCTNSGTYYVYFDDATLEYVKEKYDGSKVSTTSYSGYLYEECYGMYLYGGETYVIKLVADGNEIDVKISRD